MQVRPFASRCRHRNPRDDVTGARPRRDHLDLGEDRVAHSFSCGNEESNEEIPAGRTSRVVEPDSAKTRSESTTVVIEGEIPNVVGSVQAPGRVSERNEIAAETGSPGGVLVEQDLFWRRAIPGVEEDAADPIGQGNRSIGSARGEEKILVGAGCATHRTHQTQRVETNARHCLVGRTVDGDADAIGGQDRNLSIVATSERAEEYPEQGNASARAENWHDGHLTWESGTESRESARMRPTARLGLTGCPPDPVLRSVFMNDLHPEVRVPGALPVPRLRSVEPE